MVGFDGWLDLAAFLQCPGHQKKQLGIIDGERECRPGFSLGGIVPTLLCRGYGIYTVLAHSSGAVAWSFHTVWTLIGIRRF